MSALQHSRHLPFRPCICTTTLTATMAIACPSAAQNDKPEATSPSISVVGSGEVTAKADTVEINIGVATESETASDALKANNQAMTTLIEKLKQRGIESKDVQTVSFNIFPQHNRQPDNNRRAQPTGYQVSNQVRVKVHDISKLGSLLDEVFAGGANQINGIRFSVDQQEELLDQARRKAADDAGRKARLLAEAVGARLGRVLEVHEESSGPVLPVARSFALAEGRGGVPVESGEQTITAELSVTYALEQRE